MVGATREETALLNRVSANFKRARARAKMTQQVVAYKAKIDLSYVQRVERGAQNLTMRTLARLAFSVGVDPEELMRPCEAAPRLVSTDTMRAHGAKGGIDGSV